MISSIHSIVCIRVVNPTWLEDIPTSVFSVIEEEAKRNDISVQVYPDVETEADFERILETEIKKTKKDRIILFCIAGHGEYDPPTAKQEAENNLLTTETIENRLSKTSINLDASFRKLRKQVQGPIIIALDACKVDLAVTLTSQGEMALLLASPQEEANVSDNGSFLCNSLGRHLGQKRRQPISIQELLDEVITDVTKQTNNMQQPELRKYGACQFLDKEHYIPHQKPNPKFETAFLQWFSEQVNEELDESLLRKLHIFLNQYDEQPLSAIPLKVAVQSAYAYQNSKTVNYAKDLHELMEETDLSPLLLAQAKHALGWLYLKDKRHKTAMRTLLEAFDHADSVSDKKLYAKILNTLATAYRTEFNYVKAQDSYTRSKDIKKEQEDYKGMEISRQSIGWMHISRAKYPEALRTFQEGIEQCLDFLEGAKDRKDKPSIQEFFNTLASLIFHLKGLLTVMMITTADIQEFRRTQDRVQVWLDYAKSLQDLNVQGWFAPIKEVLWGFRFGKQDADISFDGGDHFWKDLIELSNHGAKQKFLDSLKGRIQKLINPFSIYSLSVCFPMIAGLQYLMQRSDSPNLQETRDYLIQLTAKSLELDTLRADFLPWTKTLPSRRLEIDVDLWESWGPLQTHINHARRGDIFVSSILTEHYLQSLAWVCMLFIIMESKLEVQSVCLQLSHRYKKSDHILFNLGQCIGSCRLIAQNVEKERKQECEENPFLSKLIHLFAHNGLVENTYYENWDDISIERNKKAHRSALTNQEEQKMIDQHQQVIANITQVLKEKPEITIKPLKRTLDEENKYSPLLLERPNRSLDCGLLFITKCSATSSWYIPHKINRASLLSSDKIRPSEYYRQDVSSTDVETVVSLKIKNPY